MHLNIICIGVLLLLSAGATANGIYRCVGNAGEPSFSNQPCGAGSASTPFRPSHTSTTPTGLRETETQWLAKRDRASSRQATKRRSAKPSTTHANQQKQAYRCRRTRAKLDKVKSELRRGYKPARGDKLRRQRQSYEDYLDTFCS